MPGQAIIYLKTACYSKAQDPEIVVEKLKADPYQIPNTKSAWDGNVMEFNLLNSNRPVGTLSEWYHPTPFGQAIIQTPKGKVFITTRLEQGKIQFIPRGKTRIQ